MAFPTRHWRKFSGAFTPGASVALTHGLRNGPEGTSVVPDAVLADMDSGVYAMAVNHVVGAYAPSTSSQVFLSNWDPANAQRYSVIVRKYHKMDGTNF